MSKLWTLISIVVGVAAASGLLGWMTLRLAKHMDTAEREPRYRRRWLLYGAAIYGFGVVAGVSQVLSGDAPPWALLCLHTTSRCVAILACGKPGKDSSRPTGKRASPN